MMRTVLIVILALTLHGCYLLGPYGDDKRYWKADGTNYGMDYDNTPIIGPAVCVGTYEACKPYFTEVPASQTIDQNSTPPASAIEPPPAPPTDYHDGP